MLEMTAMNEYIKLCFRKWYTVLHDLILIMTLEPSETWGLQSAC